MYKTYSIEGVTGLYKGLTGNASPFPSPFGTFD